MLTVEERTVGRCHLQDGLVPASFTLFRLHNKSWVEIAFNEKAARIHLVDIALVADDFLTAVFLYRYGLESFSRLVISRPSTSSIALLRINRAKAMPLIREFPPRHHHSEFGVPADIEGALRQYVTARRLRVQGWAACADGRSTPSIMRLPESLND